MNRFATWLLLAWPLLASPVWSAGPYDPSLRPGATCEVPLRSLRPTQFCVGELEVQQRAKKIAKKDPEDLDAYLQAHVVPIVIGPGGAPYLIDHHHLCRALTESGVRKSVPAKILENWSNLDPDAFWQKMKQKQWVYLYRQGEGPFTPGDLPKNLTVMTDDPYRSLVWAARRDDPDFVRDEAPFSEFKWADYFRQHIPLDGSKKGFKRATDEAARMMQKY